MDTMRQPNSADRFIDAAVSVVLGWLGFENPSIRWDGTSIVIEVEKWIVSFRYNESDLDELQSFPGRLFADFCRAFPQIAPPEVWN